MDPKTEQLRKDHISLLNKYQKLLDENDLLRSITVDHQELEVQDPPSTAVIDAQRLIMENVELARKFEESLEDKSELTAEITRIDAELKTQKISSNLKIQSMNAAIQVIRTISPSLLGVIFTSIVVVLIGKRWGHRALDKRTIGPLRRCPSPCRTTSSSCICRCSFSSHLYM